MYRAAQPLPPRSPSPSAKAIQQRGYREKELESFNMLRDVIRDLTGDELRTRQDILRKAIDILLTASEIRQQSLADAHTPNSFSLANLELTASSHSGYSTQSAHLHQSWQSDADFEVAMPHYGAHFPDQQYQDVSGMDSIFDPTSSQGYNQTHDWPRYTRP